MPIEQSLTCFSLFFFSHFVALYQLLFAADASSFGSNVAKERRTIGPKDMLRSLADADPVVRRVAGLVPADPVPVRRKKEARASDAVRKNSRKH